VSKKPRLLTCRTCGKKFLCEARASGNYPSWKPNCATIRICDCENCVTANKEGKYCRNVTIPFFNPSLRICEG